MNARTFDWTGVIVGAVFLLWLLNVIFASVLGSFRGRPGVGFMLGALFGPFGLVAAATIAPTRVMRTIEMREQAEHIAKWLPAQGDTKANDQRAMLMFAIREAIRREPHLRDAQDSDSLLRLQWLSHEVMREWEITRDRNAALPGQVG